MLTDRVGLGRVGSGGFHTLRGRAGMLLPAPPRPDPTRSDPRGLTRPANSPAYHHSYLSPFPPSLVREQRPRCGGGCASEKKGKHVKR